MAQSKLHDPLDYNAMLLPDSEQLDDTCCCDADPGLNTARTRNENTRADQGKLGTTTGLTLPALPSTS